MGKRTAKAESTRSEKNDCNPEDFNDLQNKIVNANGFDYNSNTDGSSALNRNVHQGTDNKNHHKEDVATPIAGTSGSVSRMRQRKNPVSYCPPRTPSPESHPSPPAKKLHVDQGTDEKNYLKEDVATPVAGTSGSVPHIRRRSKPVSFCPPQTCTSESQPSSPAEKPHVEQGTDEKNYLKKDVATAVAETSGSLSRTRQRKKPVSYCPPRTPSPESQPSSSAKKMKFKKSLLKNKTSRNDDEVDDQPRDSITTNNGDDNDESNEVKNSSPTAIALDKLKFDIKIDPNVEDRYTDSGFTAEGSTPESPETRRERIDIISRQCRLHPANKKYNQGPVENPPLITPGKMVGYTPAGQRHEVDLNVDRPTWFDSEYSRMQWDCATTVNVRRMFHDLETGMFLPDGLDPDTERRYFAEQDMAREQATEHFERIYSSITRPQEFSDEHNERIRLEWKFLETEFELIELNKYAVVMLRDFVGEVDRRLRKILDLTLTPLMITKNPMILDTLETLASQRVHIEVVSAARAVLDKIKGLFQVPENQEFREFLAAEVEKLKEKTKHMSGFDILMMTEEPTTNDSDDCHSLADTMPASTQSEGNQDSSEVESSEEEWVAVQNGDFWADVASLPGPDEIGVRFDGNDFSSTSGFYEVSEDSDDNYWTENEDSLSDESDSDDDLEDQLDDLIGTLISEE